MSIRETPQQEVGPKSRRERPAKSPLSQGVIVEAALGLIDSEGVDAVTMRRVAQELDTGPASLYVYVSNRRHLLALVVLVLVAMVLLRGIPSTVGRALS